MLTYYQKPKTLTLALTMFVDREPGGGLGGIQPVDIVSEHDVRAQDLDPIGDPEVAALLQQLADRGITPDQAAAGIRQIQTDQTGSKTGSAELTQ